MSKKVYSDDPVKELAKRLGIVQPSPGGKSRSVPDSTLNDWIGPVLEELGDAYKPHPALSLLDADGGELLRRLWLVDLLDEAISHVTIDQWGIKTAVAEIKRLLIEDGTQEEWRSAKGSARDAEDAAGDAAWGGRSAAWAARAAVAAAGDAAGNAAWAAGKSAAWAAGESAWAAGKSAWAPGSSRDDARDAAKTRLGIALDHRLNQVLTTTTPGLNILWRGLNDGEPWALSLRPTLSERALIFLERIEDHGGFTGTR